MTFKLKPHYIINTANVTTDTLRASLMTELTGERLDWNEAAALLEGAAATLSHLAHMIRENHS